jgi:hypothetical protein
MWEIFKCVPFLPVAIFFVFQNSEIASASTLLTGSCDDPNIKIQVEDDGEVDWIGYVKTIRKNVSLYTSARSNIPKDKLKFGLTLELLKLNSGRLQVQTLGGDDPLGWINKGDLLCKIQPLRGKSGLEQKLFIKTPTQVRKGEPATVKAYQSPDSKVCQNDCRELSRFTGYFIFAQDPKSKRMLLADNYRLEEGTTLVGWVDQKDGFIWDTAYGLRPADDLRFGNDHKLKGQEKALCIYPSIDDAENDRNCSPVLGGKRWYKIGERIPILGREGDYYKVIVPVAATGVDSRSSGQIAISPEVFGKNEGGIKSLENLKNVDVLFLVDGTKSMDPYIAAVRGRPDTPGVIQQIIKAFREEDKFRETELRFGFRIYRDQYAGNKGIGEGLPLSSECSVTSESLKNNLAEFDGRMKNVRASTNDSTRGDSDFEENLFGGIQQAVDDLISCPNHTKILFVIGDHGYSPEGQRAKGETAIGLNSIIEAMRGNKKSGVKAIVAFFIQTPNNQAGSDNFGAYQKAYKRFQSQSRKIIGGLLPPGQQDIVSTYQLRSDDQGLSVKIIENLKKFGNTEVVSEIVADLKGGSSLVEVITRLRGAKEYKNIPGLFWEIVKQGSCKALGTQCNHRVYDTVIEGYIHDDEEASVDVWLKSEDLTRWVNILDIMRDVTEYKAKEQRKAFVQALTDALQNVIRKPLYQDTNERLRDYLSRKGGLPIRDNSPLLNYSLKSLMDKDRVPNCEILRLAAWLRNAKQMLAIVSRGDRRPIFSEERYPGGCRGGSNIPFIDGDIDQAPLGDATMKYGHPFNKAKIFWVPKKYLP